MHIRARPLWAIVVAVAASCAGCTTVHLDSGGKPVDIVRHVGLLRVELPSPDTAVVGDLAGTGIVLTPLGWSAGYTRQRWAAIGPQCRALVWLPDREIGAETRAWLSSLAGVCLVERSAAVDPSMSPRRAAAALHAHYEEEP